MNKVHFDFSYDFSLRCEAEAIEHRFVFRLLPHAPEFLELDHYRIETEPGLAWERDRDIYGQPRFRGVVKESHGELRVRVAGMGSRGAYRRPETGAWFDLFAFSSHLTGSGPRLESLYRKLTFGSENSGAGTGTSPAEVGAKDVPTGGRAGSTAGGGMPANAAAGTALAMRPLTQTNRSTSHLTERVAYFSQALRTVLRYEAGFTGPRTSAEAALNAGAGVCQDFSHVLLWLLRKDRIRARYVAGMLEGEGASHAWVEYWDGIAWQAWDPVHHREADEGYVPFCVGRDASECLLNRGVMVGGGRQSLESSMKLETGTRMQQEEQ